MVPYLLARSLALGQPTPTKSAVLGSPNINSLVLRSICPPVLRLHQIRIIIITMSSGSNKHAAFSIA
jgi:hypothetical protein